ncbi:unnamed protein product [Mytilus coruscus]|uniref:Uncharacterized protein n=1 Tax=Mytilus coruscus TaxID=42192 RepID=A0A6J8C229_MYTCO|nr:unnamed protein product [Mytilus coruscus]
MTTASCREGSNETNHAIKIGNVEVTNHSIRIYLASSKTDQLGRGTSIIVARQSGNDLGRTKVGYLRNEIKSKIHSYLPNTSIVWSQILPRTHWCYSESHDCMMTCRLRINSATASTVLKNGGHYIKYPDIVPTSTCLKEDGVHLIDLGNDIFMNTLQGALEMFICSVSSTYPDKL